jgi:hypothetical protein
MSPWLLAACQTALDSPPPPAPPHAELVRQQLAELLAADAPDCGVVRQYLRRDRLEYHVECASGQAYRVRVDAEGRVQIKPTAEH